MNNKAEPGLRLPASVSALGQASHPAGRGPSLSSLFLPLAAVASAAEIEKDRHTNVYRSFSVGAAGFEPTASSSRTRRATNCAMPRKYRNPMGCGLVGDERIELPQVESESTALPLCKSPLFGFALSTEALLTRNIIQPPPPFVNHFFDFSVHVFSVFLHHRVFTSFFVSGS